MYVKKKDDALMGLDGLGQHDLIRHEPLWGRCLC